MTSRFSRSFTLQLQVEVLLFRQNYPALKFNVQRLLPDIAQTRHAYRMEDAAALQVVEQGEVELPVFAEAWRVGEVEHWQDGRCALQRTFLVGVGTALGQLHVGGCNDVGPRRRSLTSRLRISSSTPAAMPLSAFLKLCSVAPPCRSWMRSMGLSRYLK